MRLALLGLYLALGACTGIPTGVTAVDHFELPRYLGNWYEIARLDHSFERGLTHVTATYTMRQDGGVDVINRGYDKKSGTYKTAQGKAYFVEDTGTGRLKVSFFGPFYGGYNIIALDKKNYLWSMISGPSRKYLWILARQETLAPEIINELVSLATDYGFPTQDLIFVKQDERPPLAGPANGH